MSLTSPGTWHIISFLTNGNRSNKSSQYPYPLDPKVPEDLLSLGSKPGLVFNRTNVIDFWMVGLASVETEETPDEKYVSWISKDPDNVIYNHLRTAALMSILKYSMLSMGISQGKVYELTVATLMRSVLTFDLSEGIEESLKLALVCKRTREPLVLARYKAYEYGTTSPIEVPASEDENSLDAASPRLAPGVRDAKDFRTSLGSSLGSFTAREDLSDEEHTRRHFRAVIALNKQFEFSPGPHRLDSLTPPVLATAAMDEVARRYSHLPLELADDFHCTRIENEIARLDIITAQAANRAAALKATLDRLKGRKAKRLEQLDIINAIKTNNMKTEEKIKAEMTELKSLKIHSEDLLTVMRAKRQTAGTLSST